MEKLEILREDELASIDLEYETLDDAIRQLQEYKEMYQSTHTNLRIAPKSHRYDEGTYLALIGSRPERQDERETREFKERELAVRQRARDLSTLAALKKQYEQ